MRLNPFSFYRDERGRARGVVVSHAGLFWFYVLVLVVFLIAPFRR